MDKRAYWIWLQHALGAGSPKPNYLWNRFKSLKEFYEGGVGLWSSFRFISEKEVSALKSFSITDAEAQLEHAEKVEHSVITPEDDEYPELLKNIDDPPAVLYVKGTIPDFDETPSICVVGSRNATNSAIKTTELICHDISQRGAIIVSGGALGVDAAAHRGAMRGGSPTACILACGIDYPYLMENQMLRNRVVEKGGALITEYPANSGVNKGIFAVRNRLMSGLSHGVFVVEAAKKSGTMITVRHAVKQNRDVFALPGDANNPLAEGTNALIKDGATPVISGEDIISEYSGRLQLKPYGVTILAKPEPIEALKNAITDVSSKAEIIYSCLTKEPIHISQISRATAFTASQILSAATELELMGYINSYSGQRFSLK